MNQKGISSTVIILIIVGVLVVVGGVWYWQNIKGKPAAEQSITSNEIYNHAGEIVKIYQKDGKEYLDINFIKFLLFVDEKGHPTDTPNYIYGENDEKGSCTPVADPYCVVDNDKTIKSFEVAKNVEITPASYPGTPVSFKEFEEIIKYSSPFFRLQIEDNTIQKMWQIYIP